jgi:hypothetical protein
MNLLALDLAAAVVAHHSFFRGFMQIMVEIYVFQYHCIF